MSSSRFRSGGQLDRHHAEPVVEVLPEEALLDGLFRVPVHRRDEADVHHGIGLLGADPADHAVLDDAQQLGLQRHRHLGQLVEEERAAVGGLEQARLVAIGAGKGPLPVPEHLALEEGLGQRGGVDRHQLAAGPPAVVVDELGDQFLAGAALAADEHRGVGARHLARQFHRLAEAGRDANHVELLTHAGLCHQLGAEVVRFPRDHHGVGGATDQDLEVGGGERLGEVVPGAGAERLDAAGDAGVAGHDDHDGVAMVLEGGAEQVDAAHLRHVEVHQHDVELAALDRLERFLAAADDGQVEAVHLEHAGAGLAEGPLVVHHQDPDARLDVGRDRQRIAVRLIWARWGRGCGTRHTPAPSVGPTGPRPSPG